MNDLLIYASFAEEFTYRCTHACIEGSKAAKKTRISLYMNEGIIETAEGIGLNLSRYCENRLKEGNNHVER